MKCATDWLMAELSWECVAACAMDSPSLPDTGNSTTGLLARLASCSCSPGMFNSCCPTPLPRDFSMKPGINCDPIQRNT